jgi:phage internal scaffolding protein
LDTDVVFTMPSLTQQSHAESCDINYIMKRYGQGHEVPQGFRMPTYGDFMGLDDYQQAIGFVRASAEAFMELPSDLRSRFDNDPSKLIDFLELDSNRDEAIKLGLIDATVASTTAAVDGSTSVDSIAPIDSAAVQKGASSAGAHSTT